MARDGLLSSEVQICAPCELTDPIRQERDCRRLPWVGLRRTRSRPGGCPVPETAQRPSGISGARLWRPWRCRHSMTGYDRRRPGIATRKARYHRAGRCYPPCCAHGSSAPPIVAPSSTIPSALTWTAPQPTSRSVRTPGPRQRLASPPGPTAAAGPGRGRTSGRCRLRQIPPRSSRGARRRGSCLPPSCSHRSNKARRRYLRLPHPSRDAGRSHPRPGAPATRCAGRATPPRSCARRSMRRPRC